MIFVFMLQSEEREREDKGQKNQISNAAMYDGAYLHMSTAIWMERTVNLKNLTRSVRCSSLPSGTHCCCSRHFRRSTSASKRKKITLKTIMLVKTRSMKWIIGRSSVESLGTDRDEGREWSIDWYDGMKSYRLLITKDHAEGNDTIGSTSRCIPERMGCTPALKYILQNLHKDEGKSP